MSCLADAWPARHRQALAAQGHQQGQPRHRPALHSELPGLGPLPQGPLSRKRRLHFHIISWPQVWGCILRHHGLTVVLIPNNGRRRGSPTMAGGRGWEGPGSTARNIESLATARTSVWAPDRVGLEVKLHRKLAEQGIESTSPMPSENPLQTHAHQCITVLFDG